MNPYKKILFIEDGSVDLDNIRELQEANPEIFVIIYRTGSVIPKLAELENNDDN